MFSSISRVLASDADGYFSTAIAHGADIGQQCIVGKWRDADVYR